MFGFIGYDCEQINALRDVINSTAQQAGNGIVERLHGGIVVPMSSVWYAPEAVEFFEGFASDVKKAGEKITAAFDAFRGAVEGAGEIWAENTGGEAPSLAAIDNVDLDLNVSDIQPKLGNAVVIDKEQATTIASNLTEVEEGIKSDLENLAQNLNAESAFIGHGQADALQTCFVEVSGAIHKLFKNLTEGKNNLQSQINKSAEKYSNLSIKLSDAFNNISAQ